MVEPDVLAEIPPFLGEFLFCCSASVCCFDPNRCGLQQTLAEDVAACSFILNWVNSLNEPRRYRNGLLQQCIIYPHRSEIRGPQQSFVGF